MPIPPIYIETRSDWSHLWTAKQAEEQLIDFKFKGPGWYIYKGDALLVVPDIKGAYVQEGGRWNIWRMKWPSDQKFRFMCYNGRVDSAMQSFAAIAHAPIRQDDRDSVQSEKQTAG